jgi:hypothetical protein
LIEAVKVRLRGLVFKVADKFEKLGDDEDNRGKVERKSARVTTVDESGRGERIRAVKVPTPSAA